MIHCAKITTTVFTSILIAAPLTLPAGDPFVAPEPEDLMFYHIFLDRFENGDPSNDGANPRTSPNYSSGRGWHGGDFEGVRQRLPYIAGMGFNAIWLSPFLEQWNDYHGYGTYNWYNTDPNFGSIDELRQLISEANDAGIAVYYDMVAGHCANRIFSFDPGYPNYLPPPNEYNLAGGGYPPPFDSLDYFHAHGHIGNFVRPEEELGELVGLDDLKTETPEVQQHMIDIWSYWIRETGVSGFRVDTVKHVDRGFWRAFLPAIREEAEVNQARPNHFTFAEVFGADDNFMLDYLGTNRPASAEEPYKFDGALDFQFYYASNDVFATVSDSPSRILNRLENRENSLGIHHLQMPNFIDNHDVRRFMNLANSNPGSGLAERLERLDMAIAFMFCAPGPPIIYYGTEQGFDGGNDPANREDMFDGEYEFGPSEGDNFDTNSPQYQLIKRLSALRENLTPLRRGDFQILAVDGPGPAPAAIARSFAGETVLVTFNTASEERTLSPFTVGFLTGRTLVNGLEPDQELIVPQNGVVSDHTMGAREFQIWVDQSDVPPEQPQVVRFNPANGDRNVAFSLSEADIEFDLPMDPESAEPAISITPATDFTVSWNQDFTVATLALNEELAPLTDYTVRVEGTARSAEGGELGFPVFVVWRTAPPPVELPPLPERIVLPESPVNFAANGVPAEWGTAELEINEGAIIPETGVFAWRDPSNDDRGDGDYTYPTNDAFTGGDADIAAFGVAWNQTGIHLLFVPVSINSNAGFFTPYFGAAINLNDPQNAWPLGIAQDSGSRGIAEARVREDIAPGYEVVFTGPRGATLADIDGIISDGATGGFDPSQGIVEITIPWQSMGNEIPRAIDIVAYSALETFGGTREVTTERTEWEPGGGLLEDSDPDIFDLVGAATAEQEDDLSNYDEANQTTIRYSVLRFWLGEPDGDELWMVY